MKQKKQIDKDYYERSKNEVNVRYCIICNARMRFDCTRALCKKCYRFSDEYKQIRREKQDDKRNRLQAIHCKQAI